MLDLVERRSVSQQVPKRTIKISCCGIHRHRHMWSQTLFREAVLPAGQIFVMQKKRSWHSGLKLQGSVFIIGGNCAYLSHHLLLGQTNSIDRWQRTNLQCSKNLNSIFEQTFFFRKTIIPIIINLEIWKNSLCFSITEFLTIDSNNFSKLFV